MTKPHPRILGFSFWMVVLAVLATLAFAFIHFVFDRADTPAKSSDSSRLQWLLTLNGERRGFVIISNLAQDGQYWELWGPARDKPLLSPIGELNPGGTLRKYGTGVNGGFWDENRQPVGVCAGERGIHGARSHASGGFALTANRAWIGPLTARVRLTVGPSGGATTRTVELALNPRPQPKRTPYLIDPAAMAGEIKPDVPVKVVWLNRVTKGALHFNTTVTLSVRKVFHQDAGTVLPASPGDALVLVLPEGEKTLANPPPAVGARVRLDLALDQVQGVVRLATCAGPRLLKAGKIPVTLAQYGDQRAERTWRTAVGCDVSGGKLFVLMLARGKDDLPGATLRETAQTLLDLGASEGMNLDGGSSSSVWNKRLITEMRPLFPMQNEIHHAIYIRKDIPVSIGK